MDPAEGSLSRNDTRVKLQDLPYRLLLMLVERAGELVTREEVRQHLWPENTFVEFDNSLGVAIRKIRDALNDNADAPNYVETIPRRGYRFLAQVEILPSGASPATPRSPEPASSTTDTHRVVLASNAPGWKRYRWAIAGLALLLAGATAYSIRGMSSHFPAAAGPATPAVHIRRSVAVLGFRNLAGHPEDNWLSSALAEMLNTELASGGELRMVSGEDVVRVKRELPIADEDSLAKGTLERVRTNVGADVVVLGSFAALQGGSGKRIRLDIRLQDTGKGETVAEQSFTGSEEDLFELVSQAGDSLRQSLGIQGRSLDAGTQARASLPANRKAVQLLAEGQERLWSFDAMGAKNVLLKAVAADPDSPMIWARLAEAWTRLGYVSKSRDSAQRALNLSSRLSEEDRLLIEGQYYETLADATKAGDAYRRLFTLFPDNLAYGLRLADQQRWVNPDDAMRTLEQLRRLPSPVGDDPRIDMVEARTEVDHDAVRAQAAARSAINKSTAQGSALLVARAYGILCQILVGGSSSDQALQACEQARQSRVNINNPDGEARALNDTASLYYQLGDMNRSEEMFREALKLFRQVGDVEGVTVSSSNLGEIFLARGKLSEAAQAIADAVPGYREMGDKDGVALALNDLAEVERHRGDLAAAFTTYQQSIATAKEIDDRRALGYALNGLGELFVDRGDLTGAQNSYQEALSVRKQLGEPQTVAETELGLARLSVEQHRAADAETVMRKCKDQFHQQKQADDEFASRVAVIDVLVDQGKYGEAIKEGDETKALAAKSANELIRLQFDLASARAEFSNGDMKSSRGQLETALQDAHSRHLLGIELETRLALAELEQKSGENAAAQRDLRSLENAARSKGFGLIARKASGARNNPRIL